MIGLALGLVVVGWLSGWYVVADAYVSGSLGVGLMASFCWVLIGVPILFVVRAYREFKVSRRS